jgi:hypothetical protein
MIAAIIFTGTLVAFALYNLAHSLSKIAYELSEIARKLK